MMSHFSVAADVVGMVHVIGTWRIRFAGKGSYLRTPRECRPHTGALR